LVPPINESERVAGLSKVFKMKIVDCGGIKLLITSER